jgi:hypothetical protein
MAVGGMLLGGRERHVRADQIMRIDEADGPIEARHPIELALGAQDCRGIGWGQLSYRLGTGIGLLEHAGG